MTVTDHGVPQHLIVALDKVEQAARRATTDTELRAAVRAARTLARRIRSARWESYPWQHPHVHPEGWVSEANGRTGANGTCDHRCLDLPTVPIPAQGVWYELGGRGTGKTEGAARYVNEHAEGPACDHRLPGGHRIVIVAPTQGDAVEACVTGPSGLQTINPDIKLTTSREGTVVRWPTGARARLLGAHGPDDVERLRAAGNSSLPHGTLIETETGPRPIEHVRVGDRVWTHAGLRPVTAEWDHGIKPTVTITTCTGRTLRATADHQIWTDAGWIDAGSLPLGATLTTWNTTVTVGSGSANTGAAQSSATSGRPRCCCTGTSTPNTTAPSLTGTRSTTGTTTPTTTTQPTSSPCPSDSTLTNTPETSSGIGLVGWPRSAGNPESVNSAEPSSEAAPDPGSAARPVGESDRRPTLPPRDCGHASCVEAISSAPPGPPPSLAHEHVATVSHGSVAVPVLDLTVAGEHAFVADGILVANCLVWIEEAAAQRRLAEVRHHTALGLRIGSTPHFVISTTPKNRPEVRAIRFKTDPSGKLILVDGQPVERDNVIVTRGRTADAHRLDPAVRAVWEDEFGGTTLGRQELDGEELADVEGALWVSHRPDLVDGEPNRDERPGIENTRIHDETTVRWVSHRTDAPAPVTGPGLYVMERTIVAVDPPGGRTEAGIVVLGAIGLHVYVLADLSLAGPPDTWAQIAVTACHDYGAVGIAAEHAYGGDMVTDVIGTRDATINVFRVPTKVGKKLRAEPVQALWQQGRGHVVGQLPGLEGEMTGWVEGEGESPNRLDAMVHGATWLQIRNKAATVSSPANLQRRMPRR